MRIAHIVNPFMIVNGAGQLGYAQPITLKSMALARAAAAARPGLHVQQFAAVFPEDIAAIPPGITQTPYLDQSILDLVSGTDTEKRRKLPLLAQILDRLYEAAPDADVMVYTNIDIGLQPDFYTGIADLIEEGGRDAFTIARQTVSDRYQSVDDLVTIQKLPGKLHFGYSCFVFPRVQYPDYRLFGTCIGIQPVSISLVANMIAFADQFDNVTDRRLTFHIGPDGEWNDTLFDSFHRFNESQLDRILQTLEPRLKNDDWATWVLGKYFKYRARWVIRAMPHDARRFAYRLLDKLGFTKWVAGRYEQIQ